MLQKIVIRITKVSIPKVIIPQIGIAKAKIAEKLKFSIGLTMLICVLNTNVSFAVENSNDMSVSEAVKTILGHKVQLKEQIDQKESDRIKKEAYEEFISFVQTEKHFQTREKAKKWIEENSQEAETLKWKKML